MRGKLKMTSRKQSGPYYRLLIIYISLLFVSCSILPRIPVINPPDPVKEQVTKPDTPKQEFTDDLTPLLKWIGYLAIIVMIGALAASIKIPGLIHVSGIAGVVALCTMLLIYAISYIWVIVAVVFWSMIFWGLYKIWQMHCEKKEKDHVINELGREFHNPEGEKMLTKEAEAALSKHSPDKDLVIAAYEKRAKGLKNQQD